MAKLTVFEQRRRRVRTALRLKGGGRPRLSIHRTSQHIYAQVIDDSKGITLAAASTLEPSLRGATGATTTAAADVGKRLAERHQPRLVGDGNQRAADRGDIGHGWASWGNGDGNV